MKRLRFVFVLSLAIAVLLSVTIGKIMGVSVGVAYLAGSVLMLRREGVLNMAVTPEIWTKDIEGNLFKDNDFLLKSIDESHYVVGGKVVHIQQAGSLRELQGTEKICRQKYLEE